MLVEVIWQEGTQVRRLTGEIIEETEEKIVLQTLKRKYTINKKFWIKTEEVVKGG